MCFSAEASFGASAAILTIGVLSMGKSRTVAQRVFSCIPIIFSVQQFTEGVLWSSLTHPGMTAWVNISTYTFLLFAQVVWPVIIPLSIRLLENQAGRQKILDIILIIGVLVSAFLGYILLTGRVQSSISCHHIEYDVNYPKWLTNLSIFYFITTVISPIISSIKKVRLLGLVILISYLFTRLFYDQYLISVWCYFAALISIVILSVIVELNRPNLQAGIKRFAIRRASGGAS